MISVENLTYYAGQQLILEDINLSIATGEVTAILGPNGAGKSSVLHLMAGIAPIKTGRIILDGKALDNYTVEDLAKKRAVLSQTTPIQFPFTAIEIVLMGRHPHLMGGKERAEDIDIARAALEQMDGWQFKDRVFNTLSGGEQQRIQAARVLAQLWGSKNAYLFLDEPTSALDIKHQHQLLALVKELATIHGYGICIVLHDLQLARRYADQLVLMQKGRVFRAGKTKKILTAAHIAEVFEIDERLAGSF